MSVSSFDSSVRTKLSASQDILKSLKDLLAFLYSECCTRNRIFSPDAVVQIKS